MKIRLFVQTYQSNHAQRQKELETALESNRALEGVEVITVEKQDRLTFREWFSIINEHAQDGDLSVLANSDIQFDKTIHLGEQCAKDEVFCLSRWDKGAMLEVGADAWFFRGKIRPVEDCDFGLGIADCDYAIAERLTRAGYRLSNPSYEIVGTHVHASAHRTYYGMKKINPPHITHVPNQLLSDRSAKIRIGSIFSPSHAEMFAKYLKPGIPAEIEHVVREMPQLCPSGKYYEEGWKHQMRAKCEFLLEMAKQGGIFMFLDADIKIRSPHAFAQALSELGGHDIAFQRDHKVACAGLFIARGNERTVKLFTDALTVIEKHGCDQPAINEMLPSSGVKWKFLSARFWNYSFFFPKEYDGRLRFAVPRDSMMVHANWCRGMELKTRILDMA